MFVHDRVAEDKFVAEGFGIDRRDVMYNDFVLIGPKSDPAKVAGGKDIAVALKKIADAQAPFVSRGDKSGTHAAELRYFKDAGVDPTAGKGGWYRETGSGMGPALNTASSMNAYILADRGTWLSFKNRGDLAIVVAGRPEAVQPLRRDAGESGEAPAREESRGHGVHRLDRVARRPGVDRRLQGRRRAAVLPEREEMIRHLAAHRRRSLALAAGSRLAAAAHGFSLPQQLASH